MQRKIVLTLCGICWLIGCYQVAVGQQPELVAHTGHSGNVLSVAFSPDGRLLASGSADNTVKLWDVASWRQIRSLEVADRVLSVGFSPDGKLLAIGSSTVQLWEVASGRLLKALPDGAGSVAFSPDGKLLASSSGRDGLVYLWEVTGDGKPRTLKGHSKLVASISFSPDGKLLASASIDKTIKLWDVINGTQLRSLEGHPGMVTSVVFSPDGRLLASAGDKTLYKLWDVASGTALRTVEGQPSWLINTLALSQDGKILASGSMDRRSQKVAIKLWDVASGKTLRTLDEGNVLNLSTSIAFSPDGKLLAGARLDEKIKLWDVASGAHLGTLEKQSSQVTSAAFSPDGKLLAQGGMGLSSIKLWDMTRGEQVRSLEYPSPSSLVQGLEAVAKLFSIFELAFGDIPAVNAALAFSPDGKLLAQSGSDLKSIKIWDVARGEQFKSFSWDSAFASVLAFSPDGNWLASASIDGTIKLWNMTDVNLSKSLGEDSKGSMALAFSPNGKVLASGINNKVILWDVATGKQLLSLEGHLSNINSVTFSPDGKLLASASGERSLFSANDNSIKLWDVGRGAKLQSLDGHSDVVTSVSFSPDGKLLASGSSDRTIKLWDVERASLSRSLSGHSATVTAVAFSPNGKRLVSSSRDATVRIWSTEASTSLASLVSLGKNDWLVTTPEGFFDGSPNAWKQLSWRFNNNTFDSGAVELYFNDFFYPNLLQDVLAGKSPKATAGRSLEKIDRRQPKVEISSINGQPRSLINTGAARQSPQNKRLLSVTIEVADNISKPVQPDHAVNSGARDLRLFRNGSLVRVWRDDLFKLAKQDGCERIAPTNSKEPRRIRCHMEIPIVAGENRFTAYAFNNNNIKSQDDTITLTGAEALRQGGTIYILAIGVNKYANQQYNLKYAIPDATDFSAELTRQQEILKKYDGAEILELFDEHATKENILTALKALQGHTQPEDAVIVYFSGHGTAQRGRFYLIPHDIGYQGPRDKLSEAGLKTILAHSISDRELEAAFEKIEAGQFLLVIDACNSGQALDAEEKRRGPMNSRGLAQLAYEKGMYILTAAQSYQRAWENTTLGHGYLTYALVDEGLRRGLADHEPKDGNVLLREWLNYVIARVPRMQADGLGKELRRVPPKTSQNSNTPQLVLPEIQTPRVFYRRELEETPLIIARPQQELR